MKICGNSPRTKSVVVLFVLLTGSALVAQTNASCKFQLFTYPNSIASGDYSFGINSYGTVVGQVQEVDFTKVGVIRYSGGHLNFFAPGTQATAINARNDLGNSVGTEYIVPKPQGFLLHGSSGVTYIVHPKSVMGTFAQGINKWNSVVGYYLDASDVPHGFKMFPNGSFMDLDFPGSRGTAARGINDSGAIVGYYLDAVGSHGFIYHNGQWATLDNPNATVGTTGLNGISNSGKIIGFNNPPGPNSFLYENGTFKVIAVPNATGGTYAHGISPNGMITGEAFLKGNTNSQTQFIATCN